MASTAAILAREALARGRKPRVGRLPDTELPRAVQRQYLRELLEVLRKAKRLVEAELLPELAQLVAEAVRPQAPGDSLVADRAADGVQRIIERVRMTWARSVGPSEFIHIVERAGWNVANVNRLKSQRQFKALLGIDLATNVPGLADLMAGWARENASLIKSIPERYFDEVEQLTLRNIRSGTRAGALAEQIQERWDVGESRAALIARDQTAKLNGDITEHRQTAAGITEYIWRTSKDDLVRPSHASLEGQVLSWKSPPVVDLKSGRTAHPGQDYQCRCTAEPVLPGINDAPKPRIAPKARATPARLVPAAVPDEYKRHPLAPSGRFSVDRLKVAFPRGFEGRLTRDQQVAVRREVNSLLAEEGMVERGILANVLLDKRRALLADIKTAAPADAPRLREQVAQIDDHLLSRGLHGYEGRDGEQLGTLGVLRRDSRMSGLRGQHGSISGEIELAPNILRGVVEFARTPAAERTADMVGSMRTLVHETTHGHSPIHPLVYDGVGKRIEEATTELAAQHLTEKLAPGWSFTSSGLGDRVAEGSYGSWVQATIRAVQDGLGVTPEKAKGLARAASVAMRRHAGPLITNEKDYARLFVQQLPGMKTKAAQAERSAGVALDVQIARHRAAGEVQAAERLELDRHSRLATARGRVLDDIAGRLIRELRSAGYR